MKSYKQVDEELNNYKKTKLEKIKSENKGFKKFLKLLFFYFTYVWRWLFAELHDWRFMVIFLIVITIVGSEVWVPLLLGTIFFDTEFGKVMLGVAATCELFWLAPFTPFLAICIVITIGIKELVNKWEKRKNDIRRNDGL